MMTPPPIATQAAERIPFGPHATELGSDAPAPRPVARFAEWLLRAPNWRRVRFVSDVVVLYLASTAAVLAAPLQEHAESRLLLALFPVLVLVVLHARRGPDDGLQASRLETAGHVLGCVSLAAMLTIALSTSLKGQHPVATAVRLWLFAFVYLAVARAVLVSIRRQLVQVEALSTPTLILGAGAVGERLVQRLVGDTAYGLRPVGFLDGDPLPRTGNPRGPLVPVLGGPDELAQAAHRTGARHVILAFSSEPDHVLVERVRECQQLGLEVSLVPRLFESISAQSTLGHVGGLPLVNLRSVNPHGWQFMVKHTIDRTFAAATLIALAPLMLAIAVGVRMSSPGPILFRQRRVGRDGREFELLKFRTMREPTGADEFSLRNGCAPGGIEGQDRRTRIGRFLRDSSLDELPQFINVLRGEMSVVGPRPERPEFVERFAAEIHRYDDRHRVKSGITGWAQVHGLRGQTSIADRVEWDHYYIRNWSLRLDMKIIGRTVGEVLQRRPDC
jgi:exopolysaccharide biosynthesis polyprenyl glycosylphosphotransferase